MSQLSDEQARAYWKRNLSLMVKLLATALSLIGSRPVKVIV